MRSKRNGTFLSPALLQGVGVLLLIASAAFWALTGHQSALLVAAALSLIGLGAYSGLHISIKQELMSEASERDAEAKK